MTYKIQDLIDVEQFQMLQDRLNGIYSFPSSIIDNEGKVLTATAWQDICTKFHRQNRECEKECIKSDQYIANHLHEANPTVSYRCPHGLIDNATPIIIEGVHYGNFFTGQFFLEPPDLNFFRAQAKRYGFDEDAYLEAVKKVPIWTREQLNSYLFLIKGLIEVISSIGLKNLKEIETRKRMKENEERFHAILQTAMDGFWLVDTQGHLLEVNDSYCRMSGYSRQELFAMRIPDLEVIETEDINAAHIQKIIALGEDRFESRHRRKDGTIFDVEVSVQYRSTDGGRFVSFLRDITKIKKAEEAIRESEKRFRELAELLPETIYETNMQGILTFVNRKAFDHFGYTQEDFTNGLNALDIVTPDDRGRALENMQRIINRGELGSNEYTMLRKDGSIFPALIHSTVILLEGKPVGLRGFIVDITARKQAEDALRESESKLRATLDATPFPMAVVDLQDDKIFYWSSSALALFGHTAPTASEWYQIAYPDPEYRLEVIERWKPFLEKARESGQPINTGEYRVTCKDGSVCICELYATFLPDNLIVTFNDITERRQAEEEKRSLEERLNRAEKMESLGLLAGGVAHDLNNVLGIVVGYAELLLLKESKSNTNRPLLDEIMKGGQKAAAIVEDLLTLARRGVPGSNILNLNSIISDFQKSPEFKQLSSFNSSTQIKTELEPDLPNISGSSVHLGKTIFNLVSNASEAMPKGGVLTIKTANQYLDKPIHGYDEIREGDYVVLSVSDTGEGIHAADLKRIF